jgi:hypothetical protein
VKVALPASIVSTRTLIMTLQLYYAKEPGSEEREWVIQSVMDEAGMEKWSQWGGRTNEANMSDALNSWLGKPARAAPDKPDNEPGARRRPRS